MALTAQQVWDQLDSITTEVELRSLINQLDTSTHGSVTVVYTGFCCTNGFYCLMIKI